MAKRWLEGQSNLSHEHRFNRNENLIHEDKYYDRVSKIDNQYQNDLRKLPFKKRLGRFLKSQEGWLFVLPAVLLMAVFTFWPIIN